jgi:hypothetical protein
MSEGEFLGVKEVAFEVADASTELWILDRVVASASVNLITYDRMLQPREMNANLMCPACLELDVQ